jgi:hypothetical protein
MHYAISASRLGSPADLLASPLLEYAAKYWYMHIKLTSLDDQRQLTPLVGIAAAVATLVGYTSGL